MTPAMVPAAKDPALFAVAAARRRGWRGALRGTVLIEALIASSMLVVGIAALTTALRTVFLAISDAQALAQVNRLTAGAVEKIVVTWAADPARVGAAGTVDMDEAGRELVGGPYHVSWALVPNRPIAGSSLLKVTTVWTTIDGRTKDHWLRTYVVGIPP